MGNVTSWMAYVFSLALLADAKWHANTVMHVDQKLSSAGTAVELCLSRCFGGEIVQNLSLSREQAPQSVSMCTCNSRYHVHKNTGIAHAVMVLDVVLHETNYRTCLIFDKQPFFYTGCLIKSCPQPSLVSMLLSECLVQAQKNLKYLYAFVLPACMFLGRETRSE